MTQDVQQTTLTVLLRWEHGHESYTDTPKLKKGQIFSGLSRGLFYEVDMRTLSNAEKPKNICSFLVEFKPLADNTTDEVINMYII